MKHVTSLQLEECYWQLVARGPEAPVHRAAPAVKKDRAPSVSRAKTRKPCARVVCGFLPDLKTRTCRPIMEAGRGNSMWGTLERTYLPPSLRLKAGELRNVWERCRDEAGEAGMKQERQGWSRRGRDEARRCLPVGAADAGKREARERHAWPPLPQSQQAGLTHLRLLGSLCPGPAPWRWEAEH